MAIEQSEDNSPLEYHQIISFEIPLALEKVFPIQRIDFLRGNFCITNKINYKIGNRKLNLHL